MLRMDRPAPLLPALALALSLLTPPAWAESLSFNGTSDLARSGTPPVTTYPSTMCIWAYPTSLAATARAMGLYDSAGTSAWILSIASTGILRLSTTNAAGTNFAADTTNTISVNTWGFLCGVNTSATSHRSILNGNVAGATTIGSNNTPTNINRLSIGVKDGSVQADWFPGQLGEFEVWNVALSDGEITTLSKGVSPLHIRPQALVFYAPYPGIGTTVQDWKGNPLTITGAVKSTNTPTQVQHP